MAKIFVKLKDSSGSFFVHSQGISINRSRIVEVEKDEIVAKAILHGGLVEVPKDQAEKVIEKREEALGSIKKEEKSPIDLEEEVPTGFTKDDAKALFDKAVEAKKATNDGANFAIGNKTFESLDAALTALVDDEKLRKKLISVIS